MAIEQIKLIKKAETEAEQIRRDSKQKSKEVISEAERLASSLLDDANRQAEEYLKEVLSRAELDGDEEYNQVLSKASIEVDEHISLAEKNIDAAVSMIVGKVVN